MSKLECIRKSKGYTIDELAKLVFKNRYTKSGSLGHITYTIEYIETGVVKCPLPRKTYEYKDIARVLKCKVEDII